jgi:hypothetical protein
MWSPKLEVIALCVQTYCSTIVTTDRTERPVKASTSSTRPYLAILMPSFLVLLYSPKSIKVGHFTSGKLHRLAQDMFLGEIDSVQ